MSKFYLPLLIFIGCIVMNVSAQGIVPPDSVSSFVPTDSIRLYQDTFRIQEAAVSDFSEDGFLLDMLATRHREQLYRDSLYRDSLAKREAFVHDSLVADLLYRDSVMRVQMALMADSLDWLLAEERARKAYEDSIAYDLYVRDSVARALVTPKTAPEIELTPSIVHDPNEDAKERQRLLKNIYSPWRYDANVQIQFAQNYITSNWYQGGNRLNYNLLALLKGNVVYSRKNIVWETLGEWRAGIANAPNDTLRKYNVTEDLFRIYSKFGYQVAKNLYISGSVEFKTSIWNIYTANTRNLKTAFMTPMRYSMDFGIDYKPVTGLSIVVAPLSYKMVYALHPKKDSEDIHGVDVTSLGIKKGHRILHDPGSSLRIKWQYKPIREIVIDSEFYTFTNYKKVEIDWQTDCNFIINRFLSARLSLHPRYDNTVKSDNGKAKIQFKELLSIGFSHKFN